MEKSELEIRKGKTFALVASDDITLVFRDIEEGGIVIIEKLSEGPKSPDRRKVLQYFKIETEAVFSGLEIRVIIPCEMQAEGTRQLWQWLDEYKEWKDITTSYKSKYHLLIGRTSHLSIFGVT